MTLRLYKLLMIASRLCSRSSGASAEDEEEAAGADDEDNDMGAHSEATMWSMRAWLVGFVLAALAAFAHASAVVPHDGMAINTDTVFVPGVYTLPQGIWINASGVTVDFGGATLVGSGGNGVGVTVRTKSGVTIRNAVLRGYYYAVGAWTNEALQVVDSILADNHRVQDGKDAQPISINVNETSFGDRQVLGGGVFMYECSNCLLRNLTLERQNCGLTLFGAPKTQVVNNHVRNVSAFGIMISRANGLTVQGNDVRDVVRGGAGFVCAGNTSCNSAGVALLCTAIANAVLGNTVQGCERGIWLTGNSEDCCPPNDNAVTSNVVQQSTRAGIQVDFSLEDRVESNVISGVSAGSGLVVDYAQRGVEVRGNQVSGCLRAGIASSHGKSLVIENNEVHNNAYGVLLDTDLQQHLNTVSGGCFSLPAQRWSQGHAVHGNKLVANTLYAVLLENTTDSVVYDNVMQGPAGDTTSPRAADLQLNSNNRWFVTPRPGTNVLGGNMISGNWWDKRSEKGRWSEVGSLSFGGDEFPLDG